MGETLVGLGLAVAVGFAIGWYLSKSRYVAELARFEGRLEELQGQLVRERRALEALRTVTAEDLEPCAPNGELSGDDDWEDDGGEELEADDLTQIRGIGSVLNGKLHAIGITTYEQIAEFSDDDVEEVDSLLELRGRIGREDWVSQARRIVEQGD